MNVRPMLDEWQIPRIASIEALERRSFVELPVPGRVGSLFQDMDTSPTRLSIAGSLHGDEARDQFLEELRQRFREGLPVPFIADIVTATEVQYVVIEEMWFQESSARADEIEYLVILRESPPPPPSPAARIEAAIDAGLAADAESFLDSATSALDVIDTLGSVPDLGNPTPPLTSAIDGVREATSGLGEALSPLRALFGGGD